VSVGKCDPAEQLDKGRGVLCYLIHMGTKHGTRIYRYSGHVWCKCRYGAVTLEIVRWVSWRRRTEVAVHQHQTCSWLMLMKWCGQTDMYCWRSYCWRSASHRIVWVVVNILAVKVCSRWVLILLFGQH